MATAYYELLAAEDVDWGVDTSTKRNPSGGTLTTTQVGIHSLAVGQVEVTATWNPDSIANGSSASTTVTVSGAALGDYAIVSFSLDLSGLTLSAYVSAANTVTVVLSNLTGAAVNLASGTVSVLVFKSR